MINSLIQKIFRDDKKKFIFDNKIDLRETDIILGLNPFISRDELLLLKCNVLYKFDKFKTNDYFVQKENRDKYEDLALHLFESTIKKKVYIPRYITHYLYCDLCGKCNGIIEDHIIEIFYVNNDQELNVNTLLRSHYCIIQFLMSLYMKKYCYYVQYNYTKNTIQYLIIEVNKKWISSHISYIIEFSKEVIQYKENKQNIKDNVFYQVNKKNGIIEDDDSLTNSPEKLFDDLIEQETKFIVDKLEEDEIDLDSIFEPVIDYPDEEITRDLVIEAILDDIIDEIEETHKINNKNNKKNGKLILLSIVLPMFLYIFVFN